jgi:hypothetical protein
MKSEWETASKSVMTLAPVVVNPDMDSKYAFTGLPSCSPPANTYGSAPTAAARSHVRETTRKPSRAPTASGLPAARSSAQPPPAQIAPAARNGHTVSEYPMATAAGTRKAGLR